MSEHVAPSSARDDGVLFFCKLDQRARAGISAAGIVVCDGGRCDKRERRVKTKKMCALIKHKIRAGHFFPTIVDLKRTEPFAVCFERLRGDGNDAIFEGSNDVDD